MSSECVVPSLNACSELKQHTFGELTLVATEVFQSPPFWSLEPFVSTDFEVLARMRLRQLLSKFHRGDLPTLSALLRLGFDHAAGFETPVK